MKKKNPSELTDEELIFEVKRIKSTLIINAVLFGLMIGIATYSTVKNGLGILTLFPFLRVFRHFVQIHLLKYNIFFCFMYV